MAKSLSRLLLKIISIILFVVITLMTLFFAYGYRFDFEERIVQKTSIIDIAAKYKGVQVFVDGVLSAKEIPFQVKNVLPGQHKILIKRDGFVDWLREVNVREDFVSIIRDVILVPESLDQFKEHLITFKVDDYLYIGDKYILMLESGSKVLKIVSLFDDGTIKIEDMSLYREGIKYVEGFSRERFLLRFEDPIIANGLYAYVNFMDRHFKVFGLPEHVEKIRVGGGDNAVFFMQSGDLYRIPFDKLLENEFELTEEYLVHKDVINYDLDYHGNIFYISAGMLYIVDENGENVRLIEKSPGYFKNIAIHTNNGSAVMVLRSNEDVRSLFAVDNGGNSTLLTGNLINKPYIGSNNQILYMDGENHLFSYDINAKKKIYIMQFKEQIDLIGWYGDFGHYLYTLNGDLILEDVYNANRYVLMSNGGMDFEYFVNDKAIYYYDKQNLQLSGLFFDEIE